MPYGLFNPVELQSVRVEGGFWRFYLDLLRERTLPAIYRQMKKTGRVDAFRLDWKPGNTPVPHIFWDSDVAKWVEAASYTLSDRDSDMLRRKLEKVVQLICSAQQSDGYINTHFTVVEPNKRWTNLRDNHELYCAGHLIEAGIARYEALGKEDLLRAVCRYADYIHEVFGSGPGQKRGYCGHPEIELALIRLYRTTGEERYLQLARFFVDERGRQPHYFDIEARERGEDPSQWWAGTYAYCQAHLPLREQEEVTGHAVRAMYIYSAMTDLAAETGDYSLLETCRRLWRNLTERKLYLTGGVGTSGRNEGFTRDYDLPNETAYAETCAAVGLVFWAHRMLLLEGDARYADVLERALYNGVLAGISLDGEKFSYCNPLASEGDFTRRSWFDCACCPSNLARLVAAVGRFVYMVKEDSLAVNLYVRGSATMHVSGEEVNIRQDTDYPWSGRVFLRLETRMPVRFSLWLRIPGWCHSFSVKVNSERLHRRRVSRGWLVLSRLWRAGDKIELNLAMPAEKMRAHPEVRQNLGRVALMRGPLVYCFEEVDNCMPLHRLVVSHKARFVARERRSLPGILTLEGKAEWVTDKGWKQSLYSAKNYITKPVTVRAIPYFAWGNRKQGQMRVWLASFE